MIKLNYDGSLKQFLLIRDLTAGEAIMRGKLTIFVKPDGIAKAIRPGDEVIISDNQEVKIIESKEKGF